MDQERWEAVSRRDSSYDGTFVVGVITTAIFCRPSCPARLPKRENVRFFDTAHQASEQGFRPCKRCRPVGQTRDDEHRALVAQACRSLQAGPVSLKVLAMQAGLSASYFHRLFKRHTGVSAKAYGTRARAGRLQDRLDTEPTITDAMFASGFVSSGRFYAQTDAMLGMTPTVWKAGGAGITIWFAIGTSSLGEVLVAHTGKGLCAVLLGDDPDQLLADLQARFHEADLVGGEQDFDAIIGAVLAFVDDPSTGLELPLDVRGTAFQQRVWEALRQIPSGQTRTYGELAKAMGQPNASRAAASACGANPLAVVIPCHRVIRKGGALGGYRWGLERKRALLQREASKLAEAALD